MDYIRNLITRKTDEKIRSKNTIESAQVGCVNPDGTVSVLYRGNPYPLSRIESGIPVTLLNPGQGVTIAFSNGDKSRPRIVGFASDGGYNSGTSASL